ncbi:MAG: hypothetical protein R3A10_18800 [Caldilineaceae bacterium]
MADRLHARVLNEVHTTLRVAQLAVPPMGLPAETPRPADELARARSGSSAPGRTAGRLVCRKPAGAVHALHGGDRRSSWWRCS